MGLQNSFMVYEQRWYNKYNKKFWFKKVDCYKIFPEYKR